MFQRISSINLIFSLFLFPSHSLPSLGVCPNPSITKFFPASGPKEGGTDVTIEGLNLGQKYEDIKDGVLVAGIVCVPYKGIDDKFVCKILIRMMMMIFNEIVTEGRTVTDILL